MTTPTRFHAASHAFLAHADLSPRTAGAYRRTLDHVAATIGDPPLTDIDTDHLTGALDRRKTGPPARPRGRRGGVGLRCV